MKASCWIATCAALLLLGVSPARAQDKAAAETPAPEVVTPLKLQIVLSEYEGTNKVSSIPYTIPITASKKYSSEWSSMRIGIRVPAATTSSKTGENSFSYIDVGTNIDARVNPANDARYDVGLRIERSSLYVAFKDKEGNVQGKEWAAGERPPGDEPMIREFRGNINLLLRDGQGSEATVATDPVTGHVLKIEVLLTVLK
jgi:hypothetical protein